MKKLLAWFTAAFLFSAAPAMAGQQIAERTSLDATDLVELQALDNGSVDDVTAGQRYRGGGALLVVIIVAAAVAVLVSENN